MIPTGNAVRPAAELARCRGGADDAGEGNGGSDAELDDPGLGGNVDEAGEFVPGFVPGRLAWGEPGAFDPPSPFPLTPADPAFPEPEPESTAVGAGVVHGCAGFEQGAGGG